MSLDVSHAQREQQSSPKDVVFTPANTMSLQFNFCTSGASETLDTDVLGPAGAIVDGFMDGCGDGVKGDGKV